MRKSATAVLSGALLLASTPLLLSSPASAAAEQGETFFVAQNTDSGITVTRFGSKADHTLKGTLLDTAADGTGYVTQVTLPGGTKVDVFTDSTTGSATVLREGPGNYSVGEGSVLAINGNRISLINENTGARTSLPALPAAPEGTRHVSDAVPFEGGALVATADYDHVTSTGTVYGSALWRITGSGAVKLAGFDDRHLPSVASRNGVVHALAVSTSDNDLSLLTYGAQSTVEDIALTLPANAASATLTYPTKGDRPLVHFARATGDQVKRLNGSTVTTFAAGAEVFTSSRDLVVADAIRNQAVGWVSLTGVRNGDVVGHGTDVRVTAKASLALFGKTLSYPVSLTQRSGSGHDRAVADSVTTALKVNTCFTATLPANTYVSRPQRSIEKCVEVRHALNARRDGNRVVRVSTSAETVKVQVHKRGTWVTVKSVPVRGDSATYVAPRGAHRVLAPASRVNAAKTVAVAALR